MGAKLFSATSSFAGFRSGGIRAANPVSYAGFAWGTSDPFNELDVTAQINDSSILLGSFFGVTPQLTYYFNIQAGPGEAITKLVLSSTSTSCCFETDNYSAIPRGVPGPIAGAGLPGPDLGECWPSRLVATARSTWPTSGMNYEKDMPRPDAA